MNSTDPPSSSPPQEHQSLWISRELGNYLIFWQCAISAVAIGFATWVGIAQKDIMADQTKIMKEQQRVQKDEADERAKPKPVFGWRNRGETKGQEGISNIGEEAFTVLRCGVNNGATRPLGLKGLGFPLLPSAQAANVRMSYRGITTDLLEEILKETYQLDIHYPPDVSLYIILEDSRGRLWNLTVLFTNSPTNEGWENASNYSLAHQSPVFLLPESEQPRTSQEASPDAVGKK